MAVGDAKPGGGSGETRRGADNYAPAAGDAEPGEDYVRTGENGSTATGSAQPGDAEPGEESGNACGTAHNRVPAAGDANQKG